MSPDTLPSWQLAALVFAVAFLYSSVGFGGASGYLAAMSLFALSTELMASTALLLNVLVASIAFLAYRQEGHLRLGLLVPFVLASVPAAFVGGFIPLDDRIYRTLLYLALTYVGLRLLFHAGTAAAGEQRGEVPRVWMLVSGAGIGLLSGLLGLGGGIFLSPLIVLLGWGTPKEAAATSAGFIVVNSASGLAGRIAGDNFLFGLLGLTLLPIGLVGALAGSRLGARYLSGRALRRLLGAVLILGSLRYFAELLLGQ